MTELVAQKTKTGGLDFHLAAAACYVPVMMINYVAPVVFLLTEPREHRRVRFHAVQSLVITAGWLLGTGVLLAAVVLVPILLIGLGSVVGVDISLIAVALQLVAALLLFAVLFGGLALHTAMAVLSAMDKDPRIPVLAGIADRFVARG